MNDILLVDAFQCAINRFHHLDRILKCERPISLHEVAQCYAIQPFHDNIGGIVLLKVFLHIYNTYAVSFIEPCQHPCFLKKALFILFKNCLPARLNYDIPAPPHGFFLQKELFYGDLCLKVKIVPNICNAKSTLSFCSSQNILSVKGSHRRQMLCGNFVFGVLEPAVRAHIAVVRFIPHAVEANVM